MLSLGVPETWLPTLRQVRDDDQLLVVCEKLPEDVAERLLRALPNARLEVLEDCGHVPSEEFPKESLEIVLKFLRSQGKGEGEDDEESPQTPDTSAPAEADT